MKKNILTIAALLFVFGSFSQNSGDARAILNKAYAAFEASDGIQLFFKNTTLEPEGVEYESQSGKAFIKGNRFKLEMDAMDIWFDGTTQWVLMKEVNEVSISNPTGEEVAAISPLALLGMYKNGYTLKAPLSGTVNGKSVHLIEMIPTNGSKEFKAVAVAIDKGTNTILQIILTMGNGMKNKIDISNYNANYKFNDTEFTFDKTKHPGVEIVDLR
jgi:Outer membrane lipoprotein-sorting protein